MGSWDNSYSKHICTFDDATVTFASASKQTTTITDCPVTKDGDVTVAFAENVVVTNIKMVCKQWGTKTKTITLNTSLDGTHFTNTNVTSTNFTIESGLESGVKAVKFTFSSPKNQVGIQEIVLTVDEGDPSDTRKDAELSYTSSVYEYTMGKAFEAPTFNNPNNLAVTFSSSNPEVATVDAEGNVTVVAAGTTVITATFEGNDEYKAGEAKYTLKVIDPNVPGTVNNPFTVAEAIAACAEAPQGVYVKGIITSVESFNSKYGSLTYYIVDEANGAETLQVYSGLNIGGEKFTGIENIAVGAGVIVKGNLKMFKSQPEFDYNNEIVVYEASIEVPVATDVEGKYLDVTSAEGTTLYTKIVDLGDASNSPMRAASDADYTGYTKQETNTAQFSIQDNLNKQIFYFAEGKTGLRSEIRATTINNDGSTTGVEGVEADNAAAEVEYYNLQGVRVANPENGLYIRRQGNKVEKVLVK